MSNASSLRQHIGIGLLVACVAILLATLGGGFGARVGGDDLYGMYLGKHRHIAESYLEGRFPSWNAYEYAGLPLHGTAQGSALYAPLVAAQLAFRPWLAMQLAYAAHVIVFIVVLLWYLAIAGIQREAAVTGAALALASLFTGRANVAIDHPHVMFEAVLLAPILLAWEHVVRGNSLALGWLVLLLGAQWLPGYPELSLDTGVLLLTLAAIDGRPDRGRRIVLASAALAVGVLIGAAQIVPLVDTLRESDRGDAAGVFVRSRALFSHANPLRFAEWAVNRFGVGGVVAAGVGAMTASNWRRLWVAGAVWCLFAASWPLRYLYHLWPFADLRFLWGWDTLAAVFVGLLGGLGLRTLEQGSRFAALVGAGIGVMLSVLATTKGAPGSAAVALVGAAAAGATRWIPRTGAAVLALVMIIWAGQTMLALGSTGRFPAPDLARLMPVTTLLRASQADAPGRVVWQDLTTSGLAVAERIPSLIGYEPAVPPRRMNVLLKRLGLEGIAWTKPVPATAWTQLAAHANLAGTLGVGYVVVPGPTARKILEGAGFRELHRLVDDTSILYRPPAPRFQLLHRVEAAPTPDRALDLLSDPRLDPLQTAVVEADFAATLRLGNDAEGDRIDVVTDLPERLVLDVTAASDALLVVRDAWSSGWKASIDGTTIPVGIADYALRAVPVPVGRHELRFWFAPPSFAAGVAGSLIGLAIAAALFAYGARHGTRRLPP